MLYSCTHTQPALYIERETIEKIKSGFIYYNRKYVGWWGRGSPGEKSAPLITDNYSS